MIREREIACPPGKFVKEPADALIRAQTAVRAALWALILLYAFSRVLQVFPGPVPMLGVVELHIIPAVLFALVHGAMRYSVRGIAVFFAICLGVGGAVEIIGVHTNSPFGSYYFTDVMGPKVPGVPLLLALAYVGMGYLSWMLANVILSGGTVNALREARKIAAPLIASFIMVAWDFSMDPVWSTILHAWVWRHGGPYFGVPISNFVGWFFTVYIIFQLFALYLGSPSSTVISLPRAYWTLAIVFYAISAAGNLLLLIPHSGLSAVSDASGIQWRVASITAATTLSSVFVMGAFCAIAWARLPDSNSEA